MSKEQLQEISNLLLAYSAGEYHVKGQISANVDELDMIISGINMLGEELVATNVSRDFFSSIFNSVSDFVFIADDDGLLIDTNKSVSELFNQDIDYLIGKPLSYFLADEKDNLFKSIKNVLSNSEHIFTQETQLKNKEGKLIHGFCTSTKLLDRFGNFNGYLINIKDITEQKEKEKLILRTIFSTQQTEQKRVADDLHDSLGQELAMAQLMISNLSKYNTDDENHTKLVSTCTEILQSSVKHLREICFDLMPSTLLKGGLQRGVNELVSRLKSQDEITVDFDADEKFPRLEPELEIAIYRIVQEFINNMIKHAKADKLKIKLKLSRKTKIVIELIDNGIGFDLERLHNLGENRGIQNMHSKVNAYGGELELKSKPGKGTHLKLTFPIKN